MNPANNPTSPTTTPSEFSSADTTPPPMPTPQQFGGASAPPLNTTPPTPISPTPPTIMAEGSTNNGNSKKILAALGVFLMLVGIGAGVFLIRNQELGRSSAWDCSLYTFSLSENGTVTVANGSTQGESPQQAQVYINNVLVDTFNVPELASGEGATLGTINVPSNQSYTWKIVGTKDCQNSGSVQESGLTASCSAVIAYDENWAQLSAVQLSQLTTGDTVYFTVSGTTTSGNFSRARFGVNGEPAVEVTDKRPGTQDFYYEYTIPAGTTSFSIDADIFHSELGWF